MRILGLDTSTRATSAALIDTESGIHLEARDDPPPGERPRHATALLPMVAELLERTGTEWDSLQRLAVGIGPGTFTGLRIGIASARALARARGLELVGVSTLRSLALNAAGVDGVETVLAVLDARRGEAFAAAWEPDEIEQGAAVMEPAALGPAVLAEAAARLGSGVLAIGDGAIEFREVLERSGASIPETETRIHAVTALSHCRLASVSNVPHPEGVLPAYLRVPDAELSRRAKTTDER